MMHKHWHLKNCIFKCALHIQSTGQREVKTVTELVHKTMWQPEYTRHQAKFVVVTESKPKKKSKSKVETQSKETGSPQRAR